MSDQIQVELEASYTYMVMVCSSYSYSAASLLPYLTNTGAHHNALVGVGTLLRRGAAVAARLPQVVRALVARGTLARPAAPGLHESARRQRRLQAHPRCAHIVIQAHCVQDYSWYRSRSHAHAHCTGTFDDRVELERELVA